MQKKIPTMKTNALFFTLATALLLTACTSDEKEIRTVAYNYLDALGNYRPTDARPYATQQTCDVTLEFMELMVEHTDSSVYADNIPATITVGVVNIIEDTTAIAAFHKSTPSKEQEGKINLVKREGKWRVHEIANIPPFVNMLKADKPRTFTEEQRKNMRQIKIEK